METKWVRLSRKIRMENGSKSTNIFIWIHPLTTSAIRCWSHTFEIHKSSLSLLGTLSYALQTALMLAVNCGGNFHNKRVPSTLQHFMYAKNKQCHFWDVSLILTIPCYSRCAQLLASQQAFCKSLSKKSSFIHVMWARYLRENLHYR